MLLDNTYGWNAPHTYHHKRCDPDSHALTIKQASSWGVWKLPGSRCPLSCVPSPPKTLAGDGGRGEAKALAAEEAGEAGAAAAQRCVLVGGCEGILCCYLVHRLGMRVGCDTNVLWSSSTSRDLD